MSDDTDILKKASTWLTDDFDEVTRNEVKSLIVNDPEELFECFYKDLDFGTGGMRGIMGVGTNRINIYTIGMATQGLANYLKKSFSEDISIAIAHDSRNNSRLFAETCANVLSSNGIHVYLFSDLRPTPELSFAIRQLNCQSGIVITASHNPKEYNGYKVYWEDGAQVVTPHDKGIIAEVRKITSMKDVRWTANDELITSIGEKIDSIYLKRVGNLSLSKKSIQNQKDLKIVYTSLHGTGITLIPKALRNLGFENIYIVPDQDIPDGNFPSVESPNPEEKKALQKALDMAKYIDADIVLGTDPDADRVGLAVKNNEGEFELLNGNQACVLLVWYHLKKWKELNQLDGNQFVAKTIVTTELIDRIAKDFDVELFNTLTGFKYIASVIRDFEGEKEFIAGGEESFGYLVGDFVRDKDAVISSVMFCEIAAWAKDIGSSIHELMNQIYAQYGYFQEHLVSLKRMGSKGQQEIAEMMEGYRSNPPVQLGGSKIVRIDDVRELTSKDLVTGKINSIDLPSSNVMQFYTEEGVKITARPSGTEPKIKFYVSVNIDQETDIEKCRRLASSKIKEIVEELGI